MVRRKGGKKYRVGERGKFILQNKARREQEATPDLEMC